VYNLTLIASPALGAAHSRTTIDCLVLSLLALLIFFAAARILSRFERLSFLNTFLLQAKIVEQAEQLSGEQIELLAVFSNPTTMMVSSSHVERIEPLKVGQELKSLFRLVPPVHVHIEPAASLADVRQVLSRHSPSLLLFSGHSFVGTLALELPSGRVQLPPSKLLIEELSPERASRLSAVVLNGCETVSLGFEIVRALPHLSVICWATITEDSAARAFSQGFYDAVGTSLLSREKVDLDLAFESGLEAFVEAGFASGDPAAFLHDELHPHRRFPVFSGCYGCCPPVHGVVLMLRSVGGRVEAKAPSLALRGSRWQRQVVCGDWFPVEEPSDLVDYAARYAASHREAASAPAPVCQPVKGGGAVHRGKESGKEAGVLLVGGDERPEETPEVAGGDRAMVAIEMDTLPVRHKL